MFLLSLRSYWEKKSFIFHCLFRILQKYDFVQLKGIFFIYSVFENVYCTASHLKDTSCFNKALLA